MLEIGTVGKAHGLKGEVVVRLVTNRLERLDPGSELTAGDRVVVVTASRPHQGHHLVTFEGVSDRSAAESLRGRTLTAPPLDDTDELWVHELIGTEVVDTDGVVRGVVEAVQDNPASDLLVLDTGHLVPLVFVVDQGEHRITIDPPDGLFDLEG